MQVFQVLSLTLLSVMAANAQVFAVGRCPKPAVQANFDATQYLGKWYEIAKLPTLFQKGECGTATYSDKSPGVVGVLNRELLANGTINSIVGSATATDPTVPAKLEVSFFEGSPPGDYWVLSTDYTGHALVFGCSQFWPISAQFSWILSREPTMPEETLADLRGILASAGVKVDKMVATDQDLELCAVMEE
ncbi:unnamed protein product [Boreogadus saida]